MTFTHALATNNYGVAKFIVATSAANGTHTTLASAMAAASVGDTIFLRDSVTENVTITPGVNISAWSGGTLNTPSIIGTLTMTGAGTSTISGIRLVTNSAAALAVTGSAASIVNLERCYLDFTNATGITFSSSSASAQINVTNCFGNLGTTGIALFSNTSAGQLLFRYCSIFNTGASTTQSSTSGTTVINYSGVACPLVTASAGVLSLLYTNINTSAQNATSVTTVGTGTSFIECSTFVSGTASAISIGAGTTVQVGNAVRVDSTNTNAITGAGAIQYGEITFTGSSNTINTTTQTALTSRFGYQRSTITPAFAATHSAAQNNVTGNNTVVTVNFTTELYDQSSSYDGTNTFTAPVTGKYQFNASVQINDAATANQAQIFITTTARAYVGTGCVPFPTTAPTVFQLHVSCLADMTAGDTAIVQVLANGIGADTADIPAAVSNTWFNGFLVC